MLLVDFIEIKCIINPYAAEPFPGSCLYWPNLQHSKVKENFYLQFMSTHPIMPEFLKIVIDSPDDMPFGKKSLGKSGI